MPEHTENENHTGNPADGENAQNTETDTAKKASKHYDRGGFRDYISKKYSRKK